MIQSKGDQNMIRDKAASYAVMAMAQIAEQGSVQAHDLASNCQFPAAYAAKILSQLSKAGVLLSDRGPKGGFKLAKPAGEITLHDILHAVGAAPNGTLNLNSTASPKLRDGVNTAIRQATENATTALASVKLADLCCSSK
jgi:Rrf2 family protein